MIRVLHYKYKSQIISFPSNFRKQINQQTGLKIDQEMIRLRTNVKMLSSLGPINILSYYYLTKRMLNEYIMIYGSPEL